jgi:DNA-binding transcriptional LysR family regulator
MFLEIKKLKAFVTIVEEGSVTRAAERLNVAQPWVSVQLQRLEDMMGAVLVERAKGRLVRLTPKGQELLPIAKRLLASHDEAASEIKAIMDRDRAKLTLGVDPITLYMPERNDLIMRFMKHMPNVELEIACHVPRELFEGLAAGRFDLILTSLPAPGADIEVVPLCEYDLELFVPKANAERYRSARSLRGSKMLTLPDAHHPAIFSWMREALAGYAFEWVRCPEESFDALMHYAVSLGIGTFVPDLSASYPMMARDMERIPLGLDPPLAVRWAVMRRAGYRRRAPDQFWRMASGMRSSTLGKVA